MTNMIVLLNQWLRDQDVDVEHHDNYCCNYRQTRKNTKETGRKHCEITRQRKKMDKNFLQAYNECLAIIMSFQVRGMP